MKIINIWRASILLFAISTLVLSCSKDNKVSLKLQQQRFVQGSGEKTTITPGGFVLWSNTDAIFVNEEVRTLESEGNYYVLEIQNQADSYTAFFPSGIVTDRDITGTGNIHVSLPSSYRYTTNSADDQVVSVPMVAYTGASDRPVLSFVNLCSLFNIEVLNDLFFLDDDCDITILSVSVTLQSGDALAGPAVISNVASSPFSPSLSMSSQAAIKTVSLTGINREIEARNSASFYLPIPPFSGSNVGVLVKFKRGSVTKTIYTLANTFTAEANKIYHVHLTYSDELEP